MKTTTLTDKLNPVIEAHYGEWEEAEGYGPCGAVTLARRTLHGWTIVAGMRHAPGTDPMMGWPHYVSRLPSGALIDDCNPFADTDTEFTEDDDADLTPDELPELADDAAARWWIAKGLDNGATTVA